MMSLTETAERLREHVRVLTVEIGERSVQHPENLERARAYIESCHRGMGLEVRTQWYDWEGGKVGNVVSRIGSGASSSRSYLLGAHYDSVEGTVGADDNAAAVAVQLETARWLKARGDAVGLGAVVTFASFVFEEPPFFSTRHMGSRVYAREARRTGERIDGMICLEMVGYYCDEPGCQEYPFPLMFLNYPKTGNFIGIVGNSASRGLTRSLEKAFRENPDLPVVTLTVPFNGWPLPSVRLSDHSSFWDAGYRAVMVTDSAFYRNPYYHTPADTMDKLDFRRMADLVKSLVLFFASVGT